jgi:hypothetical protein
VYQAVFQDSGFQHPGNQAKNSLVSYPLLEELQQPRVIHSIEKATYIGFDDVVNTLLLDGLSQRIKAVMGAPSGTITVATLRTSTRKWVPTHASWPVPLSYLRSY